MEPGKRKKNIMKLYSLSAIETLINKYLKSGGEFETLKEGTLGYGLAILKGEGLKACVIQERYLNPWSSGHSVRFYNELPKKYSKA